MKPDDHLNNRRDEFRSLSKTLLTACSDNTLGADKKFFSELLAGLETIHNDIKNLEQESLSARKSTQASFDRFSALFEHAPLGYLVISCEGTICQANIEAGRLFSAAPATLINRSLSDFITGDHHRRFFDYTGLITSSGRKQQCELKMINDRGDHFDARLEAVAAGIEKQDHTYLLTVVCDISPDKKKTKKLQDSLQSVSELNRLLLLSMEDIPTVELYHRVLEAVVSFPRLGTDRKGLMFLMENGDLVLKAHKNVPPSLLTDCSRRTPAKCLCGKVARTRIPIFVSPGDETYRQCFEHLPDCARYSVPILASDKQLLGVLTLFIGGSPNYNQLTERVLIKSSQVIAGIIRRKQMESELRERTELLLSIYAAADSIGLVVTDLMEDDATIAGFSPGAEKIFGYTEAEVLNRSIGLLYREHSTHLIPQRVALLRKGGKITTTDMVMRKKDGSLFPAVITINPFTEKNGNTTRALSVINDISSLKKAQYELEKANSVLENRVMERTRELQLAQQQVLHAEKLAAVGQLSASIAHEFNSPLQGVTTVLKGVAKRAVLEEEDLQLVDSAVEECNRMAQLIRDLQNFNRPSSGRCSWINLHQVLDSLLLLYKSDFHNKKIGLVKKYADALPAISVVPDQIRQVIINLLNNAADACDKGGVITVSTKVVSEGVQLKISDTGHGIAPENLQRIFDPFFTTKPEVKGTGLGLSVCYGIIKSHKGVILVDSCPDEGTQFTIILPIKRKM